MMRSENPAEKRYRTKFSKGEVGGGCQGGGRSVPPLSQLHARLTISDIGGKGRVYFFQKRWDGERLGECTY